MNELDKAADNPDAVPRTEAPGDRPDLLVTKARGGIMSRLAGMHAGRLRVSDALGSHTFGEVRGPGDLDVSVRVNDLSAWLDIAAGGSMGAAEAYMRGHLGVSDLTGLIRIFLRNHAVLRSLDRGFARLGMPLLRLAHWYRRNTRRGSRRNIHAHYDLGNPFFELFLDPTMMYSAAIFAREDMSLEEASTHKLDVICRRLDLKPTDHLLEIGTGWGGLALHAAGRYGCRVTTTTISANQLEYARERVRKAGLQDRVTVLSKDYRDLDGQFDKLVSVEMIEAVGHRFLDTYFRVCSERLKPAGRMLLQAIVVADRNYRHARESVDFIQKYIFPGGALPSLGSILGSVNRMTDLQLAGMQDIGADYARTLLLWRQRFHERLKDVRRLGYPDEFIRMWDWYLAYCEGGFRERTISDVHLVFDKPGCRLAPAGAVAWTGHPG